MSEIASIDEARAKKDALDKQRADRERTECLAAMRRKVQRLVSTGAAPNNIAAALFLATAEIAILGGMSDVDVTDALREAIALVRLQLGNVQPAPDAAPPAPQSPDAV